MTKVRIRVHFTKAGDLRWISHRDLARLWERLLRRANLKLAFSEGFHPKPKISFPSALALGIVALDEIVEMDLVGEVDLEQARAQIEQQMPEGMQLLSLAELTSGSGKGANDRRNLRSATGRQRCVNGSRNSRPTAGWWSDRSGTRRQNAGRSVR